MNIELKPWTLADIEALAELCHNVNRRYLTDSLPYPYTPSDAQWWLENVVFPCEQRNKGVFRAIWVDGALVGNISVTQRGNIYRKDANLGYMLSSHVWSQGIMTEAVRQICSIAFDTLDIVRISAAAFAPNIASRRVLEKNGFALEGVLKNAIIKNDVLYDDYLYGKLK